MNGDNIQTRAEVEVALRDMMSSGLKQIGRELDTINRKAQELKLGGSKKIDDFADSAGKISPAVDKNKKSFSEMSAVFETMAKKLVGPLGIAAGLYEAGKALNSFTSGALQLRTFATDIGVTSRAVKEFQQQLARTSGATSEEANKALATFSGVMKEYQVYKYSGGRFFEEITKIHPGGIEYARVVEQKLKAGVPVVEIFRDYAKRFVTEGKRGIEGAGVQYQMQRAGGDLPRHVLEGVADEGAYQGRITPYMPDEKRAKEFKNLTVSVTAHAENLLNRILDGIGAAALKLRDAVADIGKTALVTATEPTDAVTVLQVRARAALDEIRKSVTNMVNRMLFGGNQLVTSGGATFDDRFGAWNNNVPLPRSRPTMFEDRWGGASEFSGSRRTRSPIDMFQEFMERPSTKQSLDSWMNSYSGGLESWHPSSLIPYSSVLRMMQRDDARGNPLRSYMRKQLGIPDDAIEVGGARRRRPFAQSPLIEIDKKADETNRLLGEIRDILEDYDRRKGTGASLSPDGGDGSGTEPTTGGGGGGGSGSGSTGGGAGGGVDPVTGSPTDAYGGGTGASLPSPTVGGSRAERRYAGQMPTASHIPLGERMYAALLRVGFSPDQATALMGEGSNESAMLQTRNKGERASGLIHFRNARLAGLRATAAGRGDFDPDANAEYLRKEIMSGANLTPGQYRAAREFMAATTPEARHEALRRYIAYGTATTERRIQSDIQWKNYFVKKYGVGVPLPRPRVSDLSADRERLDNATRDRVVTGSASASVRGDVYFDDPKKDKLTSDQVFSQTPVSLDLAPQAAKINGSHNVFQNGGWYRQTPGN